MLSKFFQRSNSKKSNEQQPPETGKTKIEIGAVIENRYRLDTIVGQGGMGVVFRAHDLELDRDVAFKVINLTTANANTRQQFLREAEFTSRLHHPHIVAVYDTGTVDVGLPEPAPFMVMEFIGGGSLDDLHGLTYAQIIDLACQICDALAHAHEQGLVHRDLKPGNVLIEKRGYRYNAKLMDFGLAESRDMGELPMQPGLTGTVFYIAPEVIEGKPADVAADLYAIGVMLYEMVTGRVPFSDFDSQTILSQHLSDFVIPPSHTRNDIPLALESIILRLLAKNPQDRFASARDVKAALEQVVISSENIAALNNLPQLTTTFIGRAKEIADVAQVLESSRLVTLVGAGGIGKTRLALATAESLIGQFADGIWLVELDAWNDPRFVPQIVAPILGVREEPRRSLIVAMTEQLREKNMLVIFDQCEHLGGACAQLATTLVAECPALSIITTSRYPLNITEESTYTVSSLSTQDAEKLFAERIRATSPLFKPTGTNSALLSQVCQRLDGIPLAIELVAARIQELDLKQIDNQLIRLESETGGALWHDQATRAIIGWSYCLLSPQAQGLLNRLSVFVGGFTRTAVESFIGAGNLDVLTLLTQLVNASFVYTTASHSGEIRYRMLEPVREFAFGKLQESGEEELARRNHRDGYLLMAMNAEENFHGLESSIWVKRLQIEYANLIAALDWTITRTQDVELALRLGGTLWQFWDEHFYRRDGRERLERLLELPHTAAHRRARVPVLVGAGYLAMAQADYVSEQKYLEEGLATAREIKDVRSEAYALCGLGSLAQTQRDYARASMLYREGWEKFQAAGNRWETAHASFNVALIQWQQGDDFGARKLFASSLDTFRQTGDKFSIAHTLNNLGLIAYDHQQYTDAQKFFTASLDVWRGLYNKSAMATLLSDLGYTALHQDQLDQAHKHFGESLALFCEINNRRPMADGLYGVAAVIVNRKPERAAQLIGAADQLLAAPSAALANTNRAEQNRTWVLSLMPTDDESFQNARNTGKQLTLEQAIEFASKN
jgi:non-specific serine/threonine protein kinase